MSYKRGRKKSKHVPQRMCVVCRSRRPKEELVRLVLKNGEVVPDKRKMLPGRGAYVCRYIECIEKLRSQKILNRAFKKQGLVLQECSINKMNEKRDSTLGQRGSIKT